VFGAVSGNTHSAGDEYRPDATVWLVDGAASQGAAFVWDGGQIDYQGSRHAFGIAGLSIINSPAGRVSATGIVKRLRKLSEFAGHYTLAADARGITGYPVTYLRNDAGVLIQLVTREGGLHFRLSVNGVLIWFRSHW
jgi:hypothetical protein